MPKKITIRSKKPYEEAIKEAEAKLNDRYELKEIICSYDGIWTMKFELKD